MEVECLGMNGGQCSSGFLPMPALLRPSAWHSASSLPVSLRVRGRGRRALCWPVYLEGQWQQRDERRCPRSSGALPGFPKPPGRGAGKPPKGIGEPCSVRGWGRGPLSLQKSLRASWCLGSGRAGGAELRLGPLPPLPPRIGGAGL